MGNAITNPKRFIEKKVLHEQFGLSDPKQPHKNARANECADKCYDQSLALHKPNLNYMDKNRTAKEIGDVVQHMHCVKTCMKK